MSSTTIFFDGFGPWGGDHTGEIDPLFWETSGTVSLSDYRSERNNGSDFQNYTFGAVAKLASHPSGQSPTTLKAMNFPSSFSASNTGFGTAFYTNKIATDSIVNGNASGTNYAADVVSFHSNSGLTTVDVLSLQAVHLSPSGYGNISSPQIGLKVIQSGIDMGTFSFDVWGAPWYVENKNNVSSTKQRTIDAYDYKYGGLYVEICVIPDIDTVSEVSLNTSGSTSSGTATVTLSSVSGLLVGMGITNSSAFPANTRIASIDALNTQITLNNNTITSIPDATSLGFTTKVYSMQIKVNGMNLTKDGTDDEKKIYLANNFTNNGVKFFNQMTFYGARIPTTANNNEDPLQNWNGATYTHYLYDTYIDNVYVIEGATDQDCLLGPTTKVFNVVPKAGNRLNDDWQGFTLDWQTSNDNLEVNLKDSNGDRSYVYTETSGSILAMPMAQGDGTAIPSGSNYAIGGIKITNSVRKSNQNTSFQNVWGSGSTTASMSGIGDNFSITNNHYEYKNQYLLNNPITATGWTFKDVIDGKFGIKKTS